MALTFAFKSATTNIHIELFHTVLPLSYTALYLPVSCFWLPYRHTSMYPFPPAPTPSLPESDISSCFPLTLIWFSSAVLWAFLMSNVWGFIEHGGKSRGKDRGSQVNGQQRLDTIDVPDVATEGHEHCTKAYGKCARKTLLQRLTKQRIINISRTAMLRTQAEG